MSTEPQPNSGIDYAASVEDVDIDNELEQSYIDYAMSVIVGRALPDVRDGLKPVHRRILYAMDQEGISSSKPHRKSSSVVGSTMGNFHPHGDSAIYDTLTRLGQDFSMRYPLIDPQGNFGSIDGDSPAAMRYTEARMSPLAEELLSDLDKDTVEFQANYDDRKQEPTVLPAAFPNLIVNGSEGIAVGMSTSILPHNLSEIIDATVHVINNPECTVDDLLEFVHGPDFPTAANIVGREEYVKGYKTGRGKVRVRAEFEIEEYDGGKERIVITELPYQQDKSKLIERIARDVNDGKIPDIRDIRDESNREGIRVVIEIKKDAIADVVCNQLLESHLEVTASMINLALVDGQPQLLTLKDILVEYVRHRRDVVTRRSEYELNAAADRAHILEGRLIALENVDEVVELIREADDRDAAKKAIESTFDLSEDQSTHIVSMQLGSLTSMESEEIETEYESVQATIERLEEILANAGVLDDVIITELEEIKEKYGDERRTSILDNVSSLEDEDLIPQEDIYVVLTDDGYIKRLPKSVISSTGRGAKGVIGTDLKRGDRVDQIHFVDTHEWLLFLTDKGNVYKLKGYRIPEVGRTARGKSIVRLLSLDDGETVTEIVRAGDLSVDAYLTILTKQGFIKRTHLEDFSNIQSTGIRATTLSEDDAVVSGMITPGGSDILVATENGKAIRFPENDVRSMGRTARGVNAMRLGSEDHVVGFTTLAPTYGGDVLTLTQNGFGKRTPAEEYRTQKRNGKGSINIKMNKRNGPVAQVGAVVDGDEIVMMSKKGKLVRTKAGEIASIGRNTKGVKIMGIDDNDAIASLTIIPSFEVQDE